MCQDNCCFCGFPHNVCKLKRCHIDCQNFLRIYGHLGGSGEKIHDPNATGRTFSTLIEISGLGYSGS